MRKNMIEFIEFTSGISLILNTEANVFFDDKEIVALFWATAPEVLGRGVCVVRCSSRDITVSVRDDESYVDMAPFKEIYKYCALRNIRCDDELKGYT